MPSLRPSVPSADPAPRYAGVARYAKEGPDAWIVVPLDPWDVPTITAPTRDAAIKKAAAAGYVSAHLMPRAEWLAEYEKGRREEAA